jgi:hypothetical protein
VTGATKCVSCRETLSCARSRQGGKEGASLVRMRNAPQPNADLLKDLQQRQRMERGRGRAA